MGYGNMGSTGSYGSESYDPNMNAYNSGMGYDPNMGMQGVMSGPMTGPGFVNNQPNMPPVGRGEQMGTVDAMGRQVIWEGPPCNRCGQTVIGKVFATLGKNYHPECFTCTYCNESFKDGQFMQHEEDPYCERCYNNLMATKCATCQMAITDTAIQASGKMYHPHHFVCSGCGTGLQGQEYKDGVDGEPYCTECAKSRARLIADVNTCAKCKKPIFGDFITIRGQRMHPEHYSCEMCGCGFVGGNCHERDGKFYCQPCFRKLLQPVCFACRKPIPGRSITALGKVYHPEHFVCGQCHQPFPDGKFFEVENTPYCELHYKQLFADRCAKCDKPILGEEVKGCGKSWHPGCFVCTACERPFPTMQFWSWEEKPYCTKCFDKLPEKVRRKIQKKQKVESTVDSYRQRAERQERAKEAKKAQRAKQKADATKKAARAAARQQAIEKNRR
mmetsp:Transcript_40423/g.62173  ORF Transcript_40423/g.62173 Transcript_40423/m.62173 type:complete len:444 (-) Transcript_40423:28-1359(-)